MIVVFEFVETWVTARFSDDERGASLIEYIFLVALIAIICLAAIALLGQRSETRFSQIGTSVN